MAARRRNANGQPIGESRKNCTIPDAVVVRIRDLREHHYMQIREISRLVNIPESTVKSICLYRRRTYVYSEEEDQGPDLED